MPIYPVNGVAYYYELTEPPPTSAPVTKLRPPLVLLHGFTGSSANWSPHVAALAAQRRVITVDLLGHGQTTVPADPLRYSMAASAQDLAALLAVIAPGPVELLGYSMGGRLALYVALTYPNQVQRLILESASPGLADAAARVARTQSDEALANRIEYEGIAAFVAMWEKLPLFATQASLPAAEQTQLHAQRLRNSAQGLANSLRGMGTGVQPSLWDALPRLQQPTLLLAGALDPKFSAIAAQMAQALPQATMAVVPDAGHTIHLEAPHAFQHHLQAFL
ncbi:MAG: 2-succinyl-6-hydroxy-2,4-cyclohexadiene-1-carboxylate synthase [Caldilineaceae bacterium]